jgi:BlaI family penicillinase repressor
MKKTSEREWELLEVLWRRGRATAREVTEALADQRGWAYSTVKTMLERLDEKGLVSRERDGRSWVYAAAVSPSEARRTAWQRFVDKAFGGAMDPALRFLVKDAQLSPAEKEALRALLEEE